MKLDKVGIDKLCIDVVSLMIGKMENINKEMKIKVKTC